MQYKHDWHHPNLHGIAQQLSKFGTNQPHQCNVPRSGQYWPLETPFWTRDMIWLVYESVEYFFSIQSTLSDGNRHMPIFQKRMSEIWRQKAHGAQKGGQKCQNVCKRIQCLFLSMPEYQSGQGPAYQRLQKFCALASLIWSRQRRCDAAATKREIKRANRHIFDFLLCLTLASYWSARRQNWSCSGHINIF